MANIRHLLAEKAELRDAATAMVNKAEREDRDFSAAEQLEFDRKISRIDAIGREVDRMHIEVLDGSTRGYSITKRGVLTCRTELVGLE
jgi:hypothetical protein